MLSARAGSATVSASRSESRILLFRRSRCNTDRTALLLTNQGSFKRRLLRGQLTRYGQKDAGLTMASAKYDGPQVTIIGKGLIGRAFAQMAGERALLLGRGQRVPDAFKSDPESWQTGPVLVATKNSDLSDVLKQVPESCKQDLIFVQNGMLFPWLQAERLLPDCTLALLYFSSAVDPGDPERMRIVDGAGKTVVWGRWASAVVEILRCGGVRATVIDDWESFAALTVEKLLWSSIFWLLSAALESKPVGKIATENRADVCSLVAELLPIADAHVSAAPPTSHQAPSERPPLGHVASDPTVAGRPTQSATSSGNVSGQQTQDTIRSDAHSFEAERPGRLSEGTETSESDGLEADVAQSADLERPDEPGREGRAKEYGAAERVDLVVDRLCEYSLAIGAAIPSREMALAEFEWRNGWFLSKVRSPIHLEWLRRVG